MLRPLTVAGDPLQLDGGGASLLLGRAPLRRELLLVAAGQRLLGGGGLHRGVRRGAEGVLLRILHLGGDGQVQQGLVVLQLLIAAAQGRESTLPVMRRDSGGFG